MSPTVTGKDRPALDPAKMASLYDKKVFKLTSVHELEKNIPRINSAVAGICKRLRSSGPLTLNFCTPFHFTYVLLDLLLYFYGMVVECPPPIFIRCLFISV